MYKYYKNDRMTIEDLGKGIFCCIKQDEIVLLNEAAYYICELCNGICLEQLFFKLEHFDGIENEENFRTIVQETINTLTRSEIILAKEVM